MQVFTKLVLVSIFKKTYFLWIFKSISNLSMPWYFKRQTIHYTCKYIVYTIYRLSQKCIRTLPVNNIYFFLVNRQLFGWKHRKPLRIGKLLLKPDPDAKGFNKKTRKNNKNIGWSQLNHWKGKFEQHGNVGVSRNNWSNILTCGTKMHKKNKIHILNFNIPTSTIHVMPIIYPIS